MELKIKNLIALQDCDIRVESVKRKKAEGPERLRALEEELKSVEKQIDDELQKAEAIKRKRRQTEQDIGEMESRIRKAKEKLANIKSNKEFGAALKEIENLEGEKSRLEDKLLEIMEKAEALERQSAECEARRTACREKFERDQKEIQAEVSALERELEKYEKDRSRIRTKIDESLLAKYDFIAEHKDGIAVSSVIKGVCQSCHMGIPPQKFNELMRGDVLMNCPYCMRIIYWGDDERYKDKE